MEKVILLVQIAVVVFVVIAVAIMEALALIAVSNLQGSYNNYKVEKAVTVLLLIVVK